MSIPIHVVRFKPRTKRKEVRGKRYEWIQYAATIYLPKGEIEIFGDEWVLIPRILAIKLRILPERREETDPPGRMNGAPEDPPDDPIEIEGVDEDAIEEVEDF